METAGQISCVKLKSGGYRLLKDWYFDTPILGLTKIVLDKRTRKPILFLGAHGRCVVYAGYQWDGASGPVIDRKTNMRAGLAHDALYQLMRAAKLGIVWRKAADEIYVQLYKQDGGWAWVGAIDYAGLRGFAGYAAKPKPEVEEKVLTFGKAA